MIDKHAAERAAKTGRRRSRRIVQRLADLVKPDLARPDLAGLPRLPALVARVRAGRGWADHGLLHRADVPAATTDPGARFLAR